MYACVWRATISQCRHVAQQRGDGASRAVSFEVTAARGQVEANPILIVSARSLALIIDPPPSPACSSAPFALLAFR